MSICDSSILPDECTEFMYLRNHFFKSCSFAGEVVQFFKDLYKEDYSTATREDLFGNQIKVSDIRLICCDDSIKLLKFQKHMGNNLKEVYEYYDNWLKTFDYKFAIVKTGHTSKYGDYQRTSYQGIMSLPCYNETDCEDIAKSSIDYANELKTDDEKFIEYLISTASNYNINNVLIDLVRQNPDFFKCKFFSKKRTAIISSLKRDRMMLGKLMMKDSDNLTICGNPYALLMYAAEDKMDKEWIDDPCFTVSENCTNVQCYSTRWDDGTELGGYRSPQNSMNNYGYYINHHSDEMKKYFPDLGKCVVVIDMRSNNQARLSGHDMDSDEIFLTSQKTIVKYAKRCVKEYPVIVNDVQLVDDLPEEEKTEFVVKPYKNEAESYSLSDNMISRYQIGIGWSANVSALALAYYIDEMAKSNGEKKNKELEDVFIITSVLSQIYIDSAKKSYAIDCNKEMNQLVNLECMDREKKYPSFFAEIQKRKNAEKSKDSTKEKNRKETFIKNLPDKIMINCKCPMQIVADIVNKGVKNFTGTNRGKGKEFKSFLIEPSELKIKNRSYVTRIENLIKEYDCEMGNLNKNSEDYGTFAIDLTDDYMTKISAMHITRIMMYKIIKNAENRNSDVFSRTLVTMYNYNKDMFLSIFSVTKCAENLAV